MKGRAPRFERGPPAPKPNGHETVRAPVFLIQLLGKLSKQGHPFGVVQDVFNVEQSN